MKNILIAKRLDDLMKQENLTQMALANKIGVTQGAVSEWLSSGYEPSINSLWLLADYFKTSVDYLIGRVEI
jgi:transcriptional regulator with XRE-family HTH domain